MHNFKSVNMSYAQFLSEMLWLSLCEHLNLKPCCFFKYIFRTYSLPNIALITIRIQGKMSILSHRKEMESFANCLGR